ncbi:hypothetical protein HDU82_005097 [Entophlyctis luteolus]|nr:hypothetical protein HDU82_005097 [Entophlyctis luteolus]
MAQCEKCGSFKQLCRQTPDFLLCPNNDGPRNPPPAMQMYFHFGISEYILFKFLVPRTIASYLLSCIALFLLGIFHEYLVAVLRGYDRSGRARMENLLQARSNHQPPRPTDMVPLLASESSATGGLAGKNALHAVQLQVRAERAAVKLVSTTLGYSLMLVAMTFNVGLFASVVGGYAAGAFLFWDAADATGGSDVDGDCCG